MKHLFLNDFYSSKSYDLTELVEKYKIITVGRVGPMEARHLNQEGCHIDLGAGITVESLVDQSPGWIRQKLKMFKILKKEVSRLHATITYKGEGNQYAWEGPGYYIDDHSENGIGHELGKNDHFVTWKLRHGDPLFFGRYGPVFAYEVEPEKAMY